MGHIRPQKQLTIVYRRIYAKGSVTIAEAIEICKRQKVGVNTAEALYCVDEDYSGPEFDYMYGMARELVGGMMAQANDAFNGGLQTPVIVPIREGLTAEQDRILTLWLTDGRAFHDEAEQAEGPGDPEEGSYGPIYDALYAVPWKFGPGWRKNYTTDLEHLPTVGEITL